MKDVADAGAGGLALGSVLGWLPEVAAILAIFWTLIRIYEWVRVRIFGMSPIQSLVDDLNPFKSKDKKDI